MSDADNEWLPIPEAHPRLRHHFRKQATLRYHLGNREINGLAALDAVRKSPLGHLLVNPARVEAWVIGESTGKAARSSGETAA
jgi:hypothetical protein